MSRNTNRLSTESDSSIRYPVRNSSESSEFGRALAAMVCPKKYSRIANTPARVTHTAVQASASLNFTTCSLRWNTPRSSASIASTNRLNASQKIQFCGIASDSTVEDPPQSHRDTEDPYF